MDTNTLDGNSGLIDRETRYANFGPRLGAAVLDFLIFSPLIFGAGYFQIKAIIAVVASIYKPIMEGAFGATPGKMILKLKVVGKDLGKLTYGEAFTRYIPWGLALLATLYFAQMISQIPGIEDNEGMMDYSMIVREWQMENMSTAMQWVQNLVGWLPLVSALFMLGNSKRQAVHDQLAETYVIHKEPKIQSL
jgi:uncharacterized RDD family membrane protein YckC